MTQAMKDALKGQGVGLQSLSQTVGETWSTGYDGRDKTQRQADEAREQLKNFGNSAGPTTQTNSINADQQAVNQSTGAADHLGLGFRTKE